MNDKHAAGIEIVNPLFVFLIFFWIRDKINSFQYGKYDKWYRQRLGGLRSFIY